MNEYEKKAQIAHASIQMSALNGIGMMLIRLKERDILDKADMQLIYDAMTKPFNAADSADNEIVQMQHQRLDTLFSKLTR